MPAKLREAMAGLAPQHLDIPYREGGWTIRQIVHHIPESHMNSYVRFKLALTEDQPTIKPYDEKLWAEMPDSARRRSRCRWIWPKRCTSAGPWCCRT